MQIGELRHRVGIQSFTEVQDSAGEPIKTWSTDNTVWASIEPIRGNERFLQDQRFATVTHKVRIRYLSGVVPKKRVLFGTRTFDIKEVINTEERNIEMVLLAEEINV